MSSLLLIEPDPSVAARIEGVAARHELRVKATADPKQAIEWMKLREFDAICATAAIPEAAQVELSAILWRSNPAAPFILFAEGDSKINPRLVKLLGADLAVGAGGLARLDQLLKEVRPKADLTHTRFRVLVVEDLDAPRDIICTYLEGLGFPGAEGARSADEALQRLEQDPQCFNCIITDIRMPKISGDQFIGIVRRNAKLQHLPIIVLTAHGTTECLVDCLKAGASGFLVKPPKREDLVRELGRAVRIALRRESPRLATHEEADQLHQLLVERGM